jgi:hypothetical protein
MSAIPATAHPGTGCKHTVAVLQLKRDVFEGVFGGGAQVLGQELQGTESTPPSPTQSPEKLEAVMNSGLQFISGLLEMATGQKLSPLADGHSMIQVDRQTGEVTMKFKLPGF